MTDLFSRRQILGRALSALAAAGLAGAAPAAFAAPLDAPAMPAPAPVANLRLALILPVADDPFYKACQAGVQEAVTAMGGVDLLIGAPDKRTLRNQVGLVNGFIKQKVDAIAIVPVDERALGPVCRRAILRGIKVVSFAEPMVEAGRLLQLSGAGARGKAQMFMQMLADDIKAGGDVAILAGRRGDDASRSLLSETMREWLKPDYSRLKLAATRYGVDGDDAGYAAAEAVLAAHPSLKGLLAFDPAALAGAARCVRDKGLAGKVSVTGFGRPSLLKAAMSEPPAVERFAIVNPVDLGYGAAEIAVALAKGQAAASSGATIAAGRLGAIAVGPGAVATLPPFVVNGQNFSTFADVF
ncbi:substrate-binding domain-containing protein [Labrys monachus]|uniref:Rhamnose transport system substrate-binding protein n=1 Tax=Labrys monachus TaxID=217067 RepID=A0ABU0FNJ4_9HYPH|nr:substrate-binding domain-containing protein [Labrys monachus]MDQ0396187.1 rhamnose transport system substrate-binding protein [Labrys monachus]